MKYDLPDHIGVEEIGPRRWRLSSDGDHEYAIPVDKEEEWTSFMEEIEKGNYGDEPEWAIRIDGNFTFTDPRN